MIRPDRGETLSHSIVLMLQSERLEKRRLNVSSPDSLRSGVSAPDVEGDANVVSVDEHGSRTTADCQPRRCNDLPARGG